MFLDDELARIHKEGGFCEETSAKLMQACFKRVPSHDKVASIQDWFNEIKKIEAGWKLFCKNHSEYKPNGFRQIAIRVWGELLTPKILTRLGWND